MYCARCLDAVGPVVLAGFTVDRPVMVVRYPTADVPPLRAPRNSNQVSPAHAKTSRLGCPGNTERDENRDERRREVTGERREEERRGEERR